MIGATRLFLLALPVISAPVVFCWLLPEATLFELFLISLGMLVLLAFHLLLVKEIIKLNDFKHRIDLQRAVRELKLDRIRHGNHLAGRRPQRASRGRHF
ncbi:hypothetical protein KDA_19930 [Dictyobacter alpinus]|uniref:Uncharacterized protein n=1 Tax=Dictyobacter alpinus TaxID=2014873 RepID=A0A402B587_9CHLR|nr:hypothetical protein [Dictyobacter alpinus]GCE26509.1 hypothetical protein KDA_19930 [Dictyobacter alpinus]